MQSSEKQREALAAHEHELAIFRQTADTFKLLEITNYLVTTVQMHEQALDRNDWQQLASLNRLLISFSKVANTLNE